MKSFIKRSFSIILVLCFMFVCFGLFGKTKVNAATKTFSFTINANDFNTTSYAANNNVKQTTATATDDSGDEIEVYWTSNQVMKSGSNMQWQKNTGYIYNSTDLGTITSVTVNSSAGTFTTYYGDEEQPSTSTTVGNGFFKVKVGSATGTVSSIVVVFSKTVAGKKLTSITIKTSPTKVIYAEGEKFDPTGLVITKHFDDSSTEDLEYNALNASKFTFDPDTSTLLETSDDKVTITVGGQNVNQSITVNAKTIATLIGELTNAASLRLNYEDNKYFEKVTDNLLDYSGTYLIVYESGGVAFNGNLETLDAAENKISVNVIDNKIIYTSDLSDCTFTIAKIGETSNYSIMSHSGKYIGSDAYNNELKTSTSDAYSHTIAIDSGNAVITASSKTVLKYNSASNQLRFRYYKSGQQSIQLYKLHDGTREVNSVDIRFKVNMTTDLKTRISTEGSPIEYGYLFAPSAKTVDFMVNGNVDASNLFKIECTNFNDDGSYSLVLTNVPSSAWGTTLTVRAYVCINGTYYYSQFRQLSVKGACQEYINDDTPTDEVKKAMGILEYINNYK